MKQLNVLSNFSPAGTRVATAFRTKRWQQFDGDPSNGGVDCRAMDKSRFSTIEEMI